MKKYAIFALILITAFWGCSKRDNPVEPEISSGNLFTGFVNSPSLEDNLSDTPAGRYIYIYEPDGYSVSNIDSFEYYIDDSVYYDGSEDIHFDTTLIIHHVTDTDYPVLYLLHGYGGYYNYYADLFLLKDILDEMISSGEIEPMIVVTPDCSNAFGGSFYTNSPNINSLDTLGNPINFSFGGKFEDFIVNDLLEYMRLNFNVDTTVAKTGISGHSMGGYGAIKLTMQYPELFGSVSSMSAPLVFSGLEGLLPFVFLENNFIPPDTAAFYAIEASPSKPLTSMMFAMGAAFTPHEQLDTLDTADTTYFHRLREVRLREGIDLPFNIAGEFGGDLDTSTTSVWQNWLANDPYTILTTGGAQALAGKPIYLDCGDSDDLYLHLQNQGFSQALTASSIDHTYIEYSGYEGEPANHSAFIAERLREVLKFHSDAFSGAE